MKMTLGIEQFPMSSLDALKNDLKRFAECEVLPVSTDVQVTCNANVVKCMQVVAIVDRYNILAKNGSSDQQ